MTVRSNKLLLMPRAMSAGLVTHDCPSMIFPSPSEMLMFSEGHSSLATDNCALSVEKRTAGLLRDFLVVFCLQFLTGGR
jgi:hypothetical protein